MVVREEPGLLALIRSDIGAWAERWLPGRPVGLLRGAELVWRFVGLRATVLYRISHALYRARVRVLPQMLWHANIRSHGLDIPPSVVIGAGLYLPHPVGTTVMARRIGARCTLVSALTIGMRDTMEFPEVGDDVFVGAGARVLGGITVCDGAKIGANAVVLCDVPAGWTAVGVPARLRPPGAPGKEVNDG